MGIVKRNKEKALMIKLILFCNFCVGLKKGFVIRIIIIVIF